MGRRLALAALVIVLDQLTKHAVMWTLAPGEGVVVTPFFNLVYVFNPGAAFSFLAAAGGWQKWFFTALAFGVSAWIVVTLRTGKLAPRPALALTLILGGALGNVIDRIRFGAVVDFLDFHAFGAHWPAFNVADSAITLAAILLIWDQLRPNAVQSGGQDVR